jgi:hypothetical protein
MTTEVSFLVTPKILTIGQVRKEIHVLISSFTEIHFAIHPVFHIKYFLHQISTLIVSIWGTDKLKCSVYFHV